MNLNEANLESLSNAELNFLAAEARGYADVGYYGPNAEGHTHTDYTRYDTKAEALAEYAKHWTRGCEEQGFVCGADMDEDDVSLCYWKENWGPLICPCPVESDEGLEDKTFEQWFFEQQSQFTMQVLANWINGRMTYSVEISHDTHDFPDAYFEGDNENRLRTMAILQVLMGLEVMAQRDA